MDLRIKIIAISILLVFSALATRLFYWQIIKAKELSIEAKKQYQIGKSIPATRGSIMASDGTWLAGRADGWLIYAELPKIENINTISDKLAPYFIEETDENENIKSKIIDEASRLKTLLSNDSLVWVSLKKKVTNEVKKQIEKLELKGIGFEKEDLRAYPEASTSAHLLGFVGKDEEGNDSGYFGLEGYYDLVLSGKPGYLSRDSDVRGDPIAIGDMRQVGAASGVDLVTNIDRGIALMVEKKLREGLERYGALSGSVIIMNPKSGAIIAMSSFPGYDPQKYSQYSNELFKNPVVSDSFEPGSVFKVIVMSSALDAEVLKPDTKCDICSGPLRIDKYSIETWDGKYYPDSTMTEVIVHSDNVGMSFVGQKLGRQKMYDYLTKFGVGDLTEIDLQGEMSPKIRENDKWGDVDVATASFGQGIAVTPIQLIRAVAAIANDGIMVKPRVVNKFVSGAWSEETKTVEVGRVISKKAADEISAMMVEAARKGEAKWTHLSGFNVAGKTGTAQIPISGHYDSEKTIASFIGFAPSDDPKFIMLVTLREPQSSPWASETAAPLWYNIASDLFMHFKIQPER